ncbi:MAG: hypothetical protein MJZ57_02160 [Bacteroidales bacterium]|nr:hypothetical protein [Bacteroidales bacterium]
MKKLFYTFILFAFAAIAFTACKPDPIIKGSYEFFEPIMNWNSSEAEVRNQMNSMSGWTEKPENEEANELCYIHEKTQADMRYKFDNDKLVSSSVTYFSCNDKFEQMKSDWTNKLNLDWTSETFAGMTYYKAECEPSHCEVIIQANTNAGVDYMTIDFNYLEFFFK